MFDWKLWVRKFIEAPGYNDTEAVISEVVKPAYDVLGIHCLTPNEDEARRVVYIDVLDRHNQRQMDAELEYNSGVSEPLSIQVGQSLDVVACFGFPGEGAINIWHPDGEGIVGLKSGYSYLVVFREIARAEPLPTNLGGIQVTVNQKWIASLKPDRQGNVTFFV